MILRELVNADAMRCAELEKLLFPEETPWSKYVFQVEISQHFNFYFGVEEDGILVGYAGLALLGPVSEPEYEIHTIGVAPEAQRRGVGAMMMENIVYIADMQDAPVFLEVRVGNTAALTLYERFGFIRQGIRRNYYQPSGADAHTMVRLRKSQR